MLLKHTDDDGDLSIFISGNEILFTCKKGHYWIVKAASIKISQAALLATGDTSPGKSKLARFGKDAINSLKE